MARSQNAIFHGAEPDPDGDRIGGVSIARRLSSELPAHGWSIGELDCWRDCGWILPVTRNDEALDLVLAPYSTSDSWMLQIAATRFPLFVARWFGATPSATSETIHQLASDTHVILAETGFTSFRWCWDGPPDSEDSACEPLRHPPPAGRIHRIGWFLFFVFAVAWGAWRFNYGRGWIGPAAPCVGVAVGLAIAWLIDRDRRSF